MARPNVGDLIPIGAIGNAKKGDVLQGKTYSSDEGVDLIGAMPNRGAINNTITTQGGQIVVPEGYHNGSGIVKAQFANLIPSNIRKGVNVGGVVGTVTEGGTFTGDGAYEHVIRVKSPWDFTGSMSVPVELQWSGLLKFKANIRPYSRNNRTQIFHNGTMLIELHYVNDNTPIIYEDTIKVSERDRIEFVFFVDGINRGSGTADLTLYLPYPPVVSSGYAVVDS